MKKKTQPKERMVCYFEGFVAQEIKRTAKMRCLTRSGVVETWVKTAMSQTENDAVIDRRLNRLQRQYERMHQDHQILTETLAAFVKNYLAHMQIVSPEQRKETERLGDQRFKQFLVLVQEAFKEGVLFADLVKEKIFSEEDFEQEEAQ